MADGSYTVTATATLDGGDPVLSDSEASSTFTVTNGVTELPDTGSDNTWIYLGIGLLLAGGAAVALRARHNKSIT